METREEKFKNWNYRETCGLMSVVVCVDDVQIHRRSCRNNA